MRHSYKHEIVYTTYDKLIKYFYAKDKHGKIFLVAGSIRLICRPCHFFMYEQQFLRELPINIPICVNLLKTKELINISDLGIHCLTKFNKNVHIWMICNIITKFNITPDMLFVSSPRTLFTYEFPTFINHVFNTRNRPKNIIIQCNIGSIFIIIIVKHDNPNDIIYRFMNSSHIKTNIDLTISKIKSYTPYIINMLKTY